MHGAQLGHSSEDDRLITPSSSSICIDCHHRLNDTKDLLDGLTSLQLHRSTDSTNDNVLKQYSRSLECEEKLVKLFDNTMSITAKEDLLHSLR